MSIEKNLKEAVTTLAKDNQSIDLIEKIIPLLEETIHDASNPLSLDTWDGILTTVQDNLFDFYQRIPNAVWDAVPPSRQLALLFYLVEFQKIPLDEGLVKINALLAQDDSPEACFEESLQSHLLSSENLMGGDKRISTRFTQISPTDITTLWQHVTEGDASFNDYLDNFLTAILVEHSQRNPALLKEVITHGYVKRLCQRLGYWLDDLKSMPCEKDKKKLTQGITVCLQLIESLVSQLTNFKALTLKEYELLVVIFLKASENLSETKPSERLQNVFYLVLLNENAPYYENSSVAQEGLSRLFYFLNQDRRLALLSEATDAQAACLRKNPQVMQFLSLLRDELLEIQHRRQTSRFSQLSPRLREELFDMKRSDKPTEPPQFIRNKPMARYIEPSFFSQHFNDILKLGQDSPQYKAYFELLNQFIQEERLAYDNTFGVTLTLFDLWVSTFPLGSFSTTQSSTYLKYQEEADRFFITLQQGLMENPAPSIELYSSPATESTLPPNPFTALFEHVVDQHWSIQDSARETRHAFFNASYDEISTPSKLHDTIQALLKFFLKLREVTNAYERHFMIRNDFPDTLMQEDQTQSLIIRLREACHDMASSMVFWQAFNESLNWLCDVANQSHFSAKEFAIHQALCSLLAAQRTNPFYALYDTVLNTYWRTSDSVQQALKKMVFWDRTSQAGPPALHANIQELIQFFVQLKKAANDMARYRIILNPPLDALVTDPKTQALVVALQTACLDSTRCNTLWQEFLPAFNIVCSEEDSEAPFTPKEAAIHALITILETESTFPLMQPPG